MSNRSIAVIKTNNVIVGSKSIFIYSNRLEVRQLMYWRMGNLAGAKTLPYGSGFAFVILTGIDLKFGVLLRGSSVFSVSTLVLGQLKRR